eukprot:scaffold649_cov347-Pavlova_lutheri.AAC.28
MAAPGAATRVVEAIRYHLKGCGHGGAVEVSIRDARDVRRAKGRVLEAALGKLAAEAERGLEECVRRLPKPRGEGGRWRGKQALGGCLRRG